MPDLVAQIMGRLETAFTSQSDSERARGASAYMKNLFPFYGIDAPAQRRISREALADLNPPTESQLKRLAAACWKRDEREWQYFACGMLQRRARFVSEEFLADAEKLVTTKSWWDTVDSLAKHTVGALVRSHPGLRDEMNRWIVAEDYWLARSAILHQLSYKDATDADRLFDYCLRRAGDREFFIRKAVGWALREYSKTDALAVRTFVHDHSNELSGLSKREALKWLERRR